MLELRVLTGTHAGARVILPDTPQQLGSSPDCDLVLSDAGLQARHAQIEARDDGTVLLRWLSSPPQEAVLQPGEAADLGPIRIAIEEADSPWRDDLPLCGPAARSPGEGGEDGNTPGDGDTRIAPELLDDESEPGGLGGAGHGGAAAGRGGSSRRTGRSPPGGAGLAAPLAHRLMGRLTRSSALLGWTLGGLGLLGVGAALMLAQITGPDAAPTGSSQRTPAATSHTGSPDAAPTGPASPSTDTSPTPGATAAPGSDAFARAAAPIAAAVEPLGLGRRVRIEPDRLQTARVRAAFLSAPQAQALREALARLPAPPRVDILSASQVHAMLDEALLTQDAAPGSKLAAVALGEGRYRVEGRVPNAAQRDALMTELARAVPLAQGLEAAMSTDEDAARDLLQAMKGLGLAEVEGEWTGSRLEARVRIAPALLPRWERALATVVAQHPAPFRVAITPAPPPVATRLPFVLRSVVGGSMPFITLADGRRLAVEGQADGWRLLAIGPDAVVFENEQGSRVTLER